MPLPDSREGRSGIALAMAAGMRPCSGSLLVVGLCFSMNLWAMGVAAAYAIGIGTAITVAALAGSVRAARGPLALLGRVARMSDLRLAQTAALLRLAGGVLITLLGAVMLQAALTTPVSPF